MPWQIETALIADMVPNKDAFQLLHALAEGGFSAFSVISASPSHAVRHFPVRNSYQRLAQFLLHGGELGAERGNNLRI
jgi:hypothetical protein